MELTDLAARLAELARIRTSAGAVVSVYLDTRWADEHQRERTRVFLRNRLREARERARGRGIEADLAWVESEGEALVGQAAFPGASGVALFTCAAVGLREIIPVRVPFEETFVVAEAPYLRPLAEAVEDAPAGLVVFIDSKRARLIPVTADGPGAETTLESEVPGRHRRGGWAQLAQARYQRHIQDHRGRHFEAVAESLGRLAEASRPTRIVLAGESRAVAVFRKHLPPGLGERIAGSVSASRHEPAAALLARAVALLDLRRRSEEADSVDSVLTEAAKGGRAAAGLEASLEALMRGAIRRLYLLRGFREAGRVCGACRALQPGSEPRCRVCGGATDDAELGEAMVVGVVAGGGTVEMVDVHSALARVGGVAATLRYPS